MSSKMETSSILWPIPTVHPEHAHATHFNGDYAALVDPKMTFMVSLVVMAFVWDNEVPAYKLVQCGSGVS